MATFDIIISDGTGTASIPAGAYITSAIVPGYDNTTLAPTSVTIGASPATTAFTITATGTLTFTVNDTGAIGGNPITSGTIVMTDSTGTIEYGSAQSISATGQCIFNSVPFGDSGTPYTLYFKQLTSDSGHVPESNVITVSMIAATQGEFIQNSSTSAQTASLSDATYTNMPIANGAISFTN